MPALADADAAKRRVLEAAVVLLVGEVRLQPRRCVVRPEPKVLGDRVRIDDLARVHLPVGIPDRLELAEGVDQFRPEHLREELRARLAVAVLARERATKLEHEIRCLVEEGAELADARDAREVEVPARVHAALAVVAVQGAVVLVLLRHRTCRACPG